MAGTNIVVSLKTTRERAQRWLVNQKYAKWVVATQQKITTDGIPCLTAWGLYYHNNSRIDWVRRVGKEVATWLECNSIKLGLIFEAELGEKYFENTYYWHNRPGSLHKRPGFRTLELHELYFGFMIPFWTKAVEDPDETFPETYKFIEDNFVDEDEKKRRKKYIQDGIQAGFDELVKMTEPILLRGAMSLTLLTKVFTTFFLSIVLFFLDVSTLVTALLKLTKK